MTIREITQHVRSKNKRKYDLDEGEAFELYYPSLSQALEKGGYDLHDLDVALEAWVCLFGPARGGNLPPTLKAQIKAIFQLRPSSGTDPKPLHWDACQKAMAFGVGWRRQLGGQGVWNDLWEPAYQELVVVCCHQVQKVLTDLVKIVEGLEEQLVMLFPREGQQVHDQDMLLEIYQAATTLAHYCVLIYMGDPSCKPGEASRCNKFGKLQEWDPQHPLYAHLMISLVGDQRGKKATGASFQILSDSFSKSLLVEALLLSNKILIVKMNSAVWSCVSCKKERRKSRQVTMKEREYDFSGIDGECEHNHFAIVAQERLFVEKCALKLGFRLCEEDGGHFIQETKVGKDKKCPVHDVPLSKRPTALAVSCYGHTENRNEQDERNDNGSPRNGRS